jgi:ubiquinol-cytochrome c reductase cytochrome b subunit
MLLSILILFIVPYLSSLTYVVSPNSRFFFKKFYWFFVANFLLLGWIGGQPVEFPFYELGQFCTIFYFSYFLVLIPILEKFENHAIGKTLENQKI